MKNFKATVDTCSFTVDGVGNAEMKMIEKEPHKLIKVFGEGSNQVSFTLWFQIKEVKDYESKIKITMEPNLNPILAMMAQKPLKTFVNMLVEKLETFKFE